MLQRGRAFYSAEILGNRQTFPRGEIASTRPRFLQRGNRTIATHWHPTDQVLNCERLNLLIFLEEVDEPCSVVINLVQSGYTMRAAAVCSTPPHLSQVNMSKTAYASNHKTGGIQLHIRQAQRRNHPVAASFGRAQADEQHLIFVVLDYITQSPLHFNLFRRVQVAFKNGKLKVLAKIAAGPEYSP